MIIVFSFDFCIGFFWYFERRDIFGCFVIFLILIGDDWYFWVFGDMIFLDGVDFLFIWNFIFGIIFCFFFVFLWWIMIEFIWFWLRNLFVVNNGCFFFFLLGVFIILVDVSLNVFEDLWLKLVLLFGCFFIVFDLLCLLIGLLYFFFNLCILVFEWIEGDFWKWFCCFCMILFKGMVFEYGINCMFCVCIIFFLVFWCLFDLVGLGVVIFVCGFCLVLRRVSFSLLVVFFGCWRLVNVLFIVVDFVFCVLLEFGKLNVFLFGIWICLIIIGGVGGFFWWLLVLFFWLRVFVSWVGILGSFIWILFWFGILGIIFVFLVVLFEFILFMCDGKFLDIKFGGFIFCGVLSGVLFNCVFVWFFVLVFLIKLDVLCGFDWWMLFFIFVIMLILDFDGIISVLLVVGIWWILLVFFCVLILCCLMWLKILIFLVLLIFNFCMFFIEFFWWWFVIVVFFFLLSIGFLYLWDIWLLMFMF